jgi:hypothetical protein
VPELLPVKTPVFVTEPPLGSWTDQVTPAVFAAPSTVALNEAVFPVSTEALVGEMVTAENRRSP